MLKNWDPAFSLSFKNCNFWDKEKWHHKRSADKITLRKAVQAQGYILMTNVQPASAPPGD